MYLPYGHSFRKPTSSIGCQSKRGEFLLAVDGRVPEGRDPALDGFTGFASSTLLEDGVPDPDDALDESPAQIEDDEDDHQLEGPRGFQIRLLVILSHLWLLFLVTKCRGFPVKSWASRRRFSR